MPKVLIVDDDRSVARLFSRILQAQGHDVHIALNAASGLRALACFQPDAVLVDLRMPVMNGLTFLRHLRAQEEQAQTPVAIVTGDYFVDDPVIAEIQGLEADLYFKPLWMQDLVRVTERLLSRRTRSRRQNGERCSPKHTDGC